MGLMDRVKAFFDKDPKNRELSSSVITHDRVDDGYLTDFRERAPKFEELFENAPDVPVGATPEKCPSCGHADDEDSGDRWYAIDGDKVVCQACAHEVAMPEAPYSNWDDLVSDSFRSYFTHDEPHVKGSGEIKPSHELHRRIMSSVVNSDEFLDTRPMTRMNDVESAWAAMALTHKLKDSLREGALQEYVRRSEQMAEQEHQIEDAERKLEELRDAYEKGALTDEEKERLRELADQHDQASAELGTLVQDSQANPISVEAIEEIHEAASEAQSDAELMASIPGTGPGSGQRINPETMFKLAEQWRESDVLKRVAEIMGRMERDMRYHRANRIVGGFEEIVDVDLGDDIPHVLPHEIAKMRSPLLKKQFQRQFIEKNLVQYDMRGNEPAGKGPVVVLVDGSSSMSGDRNAWARATALALVNIAHKERRDAAVVEFSSAGSQMEWFFEGRQPLDIETIVDCAGHFFAGGTDILPALERAKVIMERVPEFHNADVVLVSDGEDYYGDGDQQIKDYLHGRGVRIHGVAVGDSLRYIEQMCDPITLVSDFALDGPNNATKALAENLS